MNLKARWITIHFLWILSCLGLSNSPGQDRLEIGKTRTPGSWDWVPAQGDFFWGLHHLEDQIDVLNRSPIANKLYQTSLWQKGQELLLKEWKDRKSDLAVWKARIDNPAAREIRAFLYDIASADLFLYADQNLSRTVEQWNSILPDVEKLSSSKTTSEVKADILAKWVDELVPRIQFPTLMLAGRYSNVDRALARIDELEGAIRLGISFVPDIASIFRTLRRIEDKRGTRLEWRIATEMIPWDQIPETDVLDRETLQDLRLACKDKTILFSVGTLDDYFCVVVSGDKEWTSKFGSDSHLGQHPTIQSLLSALELKDSGETQTSHLVPTSTYQTSDEVVSAFQKLLLDGFFRKIARTALLPLIEQQPVESDTAVWLTTVLDDATWLDDRIGQHVVRYRGASRIGWISDLGAESVQIDRTPMHLMRSDQTLEGIHRVGSQPILFLNMNFTPHLEYFATARQIVRRMKKDFEELIRIDEAGTDVGWLKPIHTQIQTLWPLVVALTEEWQKRILPSLSGEHLVLVQSGGLQSRQWHPNFAVSNELLPLPEIALASRLGNPDEFENGVLTMVRSIGSLLKSYGALPTKSPSLNQTLNWNLGTLPQDFAKAQVGTLEGILATGSRWTWLGYSKEQWQSFVLEDEKPTNSPRDLLGFDQADGPLASAALVDFSGLAKLGKPWLRHLVDQAKTDDQGNLKIPPTSTGRRLILSAQEVKEFFDCFDTLGRLTSFSKGTQDGYTFSRSRYDWRTE